MSRFYKYITSAVVVFFLLSLQILFAQNNSLDKLLIERNQLYSKYDDLRNQSSRNKKAQAEYEQVNYQLLQKDAEIIALIKDLQANYNSSLKRSEILSASLKLQDKKNRKFLVEIIDSLEAKTKVQKSILDSLSDMTSMRSDEMASKEENLSLLSDNYNTLSNDYNAVKEHAAILERQNKQMIIYVAIVGVILLALLIYYIAKFIRSKKENLIPKQNSDSGSVSYKPITGFSTAAYTSNITNVLDVKLEQIEKLGKLRDKGLISDQEFDAQKQQILKD
ncbi:MAG TPA: SHOCT domain-containing protein [Bacteroidia bacterium]|nr:SHOCT domain-containing protein [Bacteroidia bacterium]HNT79548.1 SHOCT domain-containing protein [Bacteroidia bacterium]